MKMTSKNKGTRQKKRRATEHCVLSIDTEYWEQTIEDVSLSSGNDNKTVKVIRYKEGFLGVFNPSISEYVHFSFEDLDKFIDYIKPYKKIKLLSFNTFAELQILLDVFVKHKYELSREFSLGNSIYVKLVKRDNTSKGKEGGEGGKEGGKIVQEIEFIDAMKLSNAQSLLDLVSILKDKSEYVKQYIRSIKSPIKLTEGYDYDRYAEMKAKRADMKSWWQENKDEVLYYNLLDCVLQYLAISEFQQKLDEVVQIINKSLASTGANKKIHIETPNLLGGITLGTWIVKTVDQLQNKLCREWMAATKEVGNEVENDVSNGFKKLVWNIKNIYYGGGIILNIPVEHQMKEQTITQIDAVSLYPVSLAIACNFLPSSMNDLTCVDFSTDLLTDNNKFFIARCTIRRHRARYNLRGSKIIIKDQSVIDFNNLDDIMYVTAYADTVKDVWINKLQYLALRDLGYDIDVDEVIAWKVAEDDDSVDNILLKNFIMTILLKRLYFKSKNNKSLDYILKILMNSLYGKFAEKRLTKISNKLISSMITMTSNYIMLKMSKLLIDNNVKIYEYATDSIKISHLPDRVIDKITAEVKQLLAKNLATELKELLEQFYTKAFSVEVQDKKCVIFRNKVYAIHDNTDIIKEAHHAVHLPKGYVKTWHKYMLQNFTKMTFFDVIAWERESYMKVDEWQQLKEKMEKKINAENQELIKQLPDPAAIQQLQKNAATLEKVNLLLGKSIVEQHSFMYFPDTKLCYFPELLKKNGYKELLKKVLDNKNKSVLSFIRMREFKSDAEFLTYWKEFQRFKQTIKRWYTRYMRDGRSISVRVDGKKYTVAFNVMTLNQIATLINTKTTVAKLHKEQLIDADIAFGTVNTASVGNKYKEKYVFLDQKL